MSQRFRLAIVLRLREMAEETARIGLGHAVDDHQRALAAVEAAVRRQADEMHFLDELQRGTAEAGQLRSACDAIAAAGRAVGHAQERLQQASSALFDARRVLAEATRQREVVERLRDRFLAEERREADRLDTLAMSEIGSTRHALRSIEERR